MSLPNHTPVSFDASLFSVNRNNFPADELAKYAGKHVAWSLDGSRILASGDNFDEVENQLRASGLDPSQVVESYVPSSSEHTFL